VPGVGRVTVQTEAGRIRRLDVAGVAPEDAAACAGEAPGGERLADRLGSEVAAAVAAVAVCSEEEGARRRASGNESDEDREP